MARVTLYGLIAIGLAVAVALGFAFGRQRPLPIQCQVAQAGLLVTTLLDAGEAREVTHRLDLYREVSN